jgi:tetratricopeptide (TPR) repeat protein
MINTLILASAVSLMQLGDVEPTLNLEVRVQLLEDRKKEDARLLPQRLEQSPSVDLTGVWYYINQGELESARLEIDRLRGQFLIWEPPHSVVATIRARTLFQRGQLQVAARYLAETDVDIGLKQELSELLSARALLQAKLGYWARAQELATQAEDFGTVVWNELGWVALDLGEAVEALKFFDKSMGSQNEQDALRGRLRSLLAIGELVHAENLARRTGEFESISSELAGRHASQALTAAHEQEWGEAKNFAENAERLGSPVWTAIGWIALEKDRPDLALNFVEEIIRGTGGIEANQLEALALHKLGRQEEAETLLNDSQSRRYFVQ